MIVKIFEFDKIYVYIYILMFVIWLNYIVYVVGVIVKVYVLEIN